MTIGVRTRPIDSHARLAAAQRGGPTACVRACSRGIRQRQRFRQRPLLLEGRLKQAFETILIASSFMRVHAALCLDVALVDDTNETGLMFATTYSRVSNATASSQKVTPLTRPDVTL